MSAIYTKSAFLFLFILLFLEFYLLSIGLRVYDYRLSSVLLLFSGLFSGVVFLSLSVDRLQGVYLATKSRYKLLPFVLCIGLFYLSYDLISTIATKFPIDYYKPSGSDVIPQIGILVNRLLDGQYAYTLISEWNLSHSLFPTYLPLQWLPYVIPEILGMDYRVFAYLVFVVVTLYILKSNIKNEGSIYSTLFISVFPPLILYYLMLNDPSEAFRHCVELLIVSYYFLLAYSLSTFNWSSISVLLGFCLLSRYSIVFFVPLFLIILYRQKGVTYLVKSLSVMLLMFLIFYVPFMIEDPLFYFKGYNYHSKAALSAWKVVSWQPTTDEGPYSLIQGLGVAIFFFENISGELIDKLNACRLSHLISSIISVVLLFLWYIKYEKRILPGMFLLGALKIYLVVFYNFIQIPFNYLFWILPMISVIMLSSLSNCRLDPTSS